MKMCFNWKVVTGVAVAGLAVFAFAPSLIGATLPVLLIAACLLSLVVMMRAMSGGSRCDRPSTGNDTDSSSDASSSEQARLRAEIDQLRSGGAARRNVAAILERLP